MKCELVVIVNIVFIQNNYVSLQGRWGDLKPTLAWLCSKVLSQGIEKNHHQHPTNNNKNSH